MTTPASGQISMSDISAITKASATAQVSLGDTTSRQLAGVASGAISLSNFYNKPASGRILLTGIGTYTFIVPVYQYFDAYVAGGGGGGGGGGTNVPFVLINGGSGGGNGGTTVFYGPITLTGGGGFGGNGGCGGGNGGGNGTGSGGTDQGAIGGAGGAGGASNGPGCTGQNGGTGNRRYQRHIFFSGSYLVWGGTYTVTVGAGGAGGPNSPFGGGYGGAGGQGYIDMYYW